MLQADDINNDSSDDGLNQSFVAHTIMPASLSPPFNPDLTMLHYDKLLTHWAQALNTTIENLTNRLTNKTTNDTLSMGAGTESEAGKDSLTLLITLTVCYALIFVAGVLGNLITCIVISRNNFMHTATNFYLFNLAVSDLILLMSGVPQELYNLWYPDSYPFTDAMCRMGSVLSEMAANTTVLTITAFTVERYIAICHPFRQHTMSKLSRAIKFIFAIWLTAFLLALPQAVQFSVVHQGGGYSCTMEDDFYAHVFAVSGFIFFCGPMTAICVLYVLIGVKLKRSRLLQSQPRRAFDANRGLNAQSRVIRMLVAVAVAFFLCWAPFHAQRLMAVYGLSLINIGINRDSFNDYFRILDYTSGVLYFLSTCINPLLYNIMSHKFREAFKITLTRQFGLAGKQQQSLYQHNYSALLRHNGSMRLQTHSVNNNALEPYGSYRVVQFRCRDASHQLSLQDSIRTTTTTINSSSSTALVSSNAAGRSRCCHTAVPHRALQAQISQLSSLGDANSLLETQVDMPVNYRAKRALLATNNGALLVSAKPHATSQPSTPLAASKRLKLSRVISRRDELAYNNAGGSSTHVELMCTESLPEQQLGGGNAETAGTRKFPWRKMRQKEDKSAATTKLMNEGVGQGCGMPKSL